MIAALLVLAGYLVGSVPFGYWLVRLVRGVDIRRAGSGNIGATNVWRTFGWRSGLPVALFDVAKGFVPALAGTIVAGELVGVLAGAAAMVGHWRPLFLGFARGGKTVATAGGAFLGVALWVGLIGAGVWIGGLCALPLRVACLDARGGHAARGSSPSRRAVAGGLLRCGGRDCGDLVAPAEHQPARGRHREPVRAAS